MALSDNVTLAQAESALIITGVRGGEGAIASSKVNCCALLEDGRLVGSGHPRFWLKGPVTVFDTCRQTALKCAMRWPWR